MKKRKLWVSVSAGFLALAMVLSMLAGVIPTRASADSSSELKSQLDALKERYAENQSQIDGLREQQSDNLTEIEAIVARKNNIDREIALLYEQLDIINAQISAYSLLIADKQEELDAAQETLTRLNQQYRERIRTMEAEGNISYWSVLFKASSFSDLLDRLNMIQEIAEADKRRLEEMSRAAEAVTAAQAALTAEKDALEEIRLQMAVTQAELDTRREEADALLRQLLERRDEYDALIAAGLDRQDALLEEIARKEQEFNEARRQEEAAQKPPASDGPVAANPGGWVIPCSYVYVSSPFNPGRMHPILGYVRAHNGIDLAAYQGNPVYATRSGTVTTASEAYEAGNYVTINHGDGFSSTYLHMLRFVVSAGEHVEAGEIIGYVGSTGLSEGPHLHFGLIYNGTYVNPADYMNF